MQTLTPIKIDITRTNTSRLSEVDFNNLPFGKIKSDHMFMAQYIDGKWSKLEILPFGNLSLSPATSALHYGQSLFEGLKAFKTVDGRIGVFRPRENALRMARTAARLAMAPIPEEIFMEGLQQLLELDKAWVPDGEDNSLYIRPVQFATEANVGVHASDSYSFIIFTVPVGKYYGKEVNVYVEDTYIRAARGGTGNVKAAGNYAPTLLPAQAVRDKGYDQILWSQRIDGTYYAGEIGTMNFFVQIGDKLITPELDGTILPGVTRECIITMAKEMGIEVEERMITIREIFDAAENGTLKDAFGAGTAAVITHIKGLGYKEMHWDLPPVSEREYSPVFKQKLSDIRLGKEEDVHNWMHWI